MSISTTSPLYDFQQALQNNSNNLDTNVKYDAKSVTQKVKIGTTASAISRALKFTENAKNAIRENNQVRQIFLEAVLSHYNAKFFNELDPAIQAAFRGTHASTDAGDLGLDGEGNVTSGKPLTFRRIKAVLDAIEAKDKAYEDSKTLVSDEVVNKRTELLTTIYADRALQRLTAERTDGKTPIVYQAYQVENAKRHIDSTMRKLAKNKSENQTFKPFSTLRKNFILLIAGAVGLNHYNWSYGTTTINGVTIKNCDLRDREISQIFDDLIREFNEEHPDLKI